MGRGVPLRIAYLVPYAPTRIRTRPFNLIRALAAAGHDVTVLTPWGGPDEQSALADMAAAGVRVVAEPISRLRSAWNCARALPGRDPLQAHYSWLPRLARRLACLISETPVDVLHVEHLRGARYGLAAADLMGKAGSRRLPIVWDSVDCISSLFRRAATEGGAVRVRAAARFELPRTERYEPHLAARFDRVLMTSDVDRRDLLQLAERNSADLRPDRVEVVPNGVDLDYFYPSTDAREPLTLVITGKMSYHANATAVVRFVEDVMPAVWRQIPDARLWVVGKNPPPEVARLGRSNVLVTGAVEDIRPYLRRAAIAVAPIQYGVGIQNKVLEAFACGTPVVATPQAVSALEAKPGKDLVVASAPAELAASIIALLGDPGRQASVGAAGRAFVECHHDWRTIAVRLAEIYADAAA
jgi:polysaccharide biosynthesis protein PslH